MLYPKKPKPNLIQVYLTILRLQMRCMKFHFSLLWQYGDFNLLENRVLSTYIYAELLLWDFYPYKGKYHGGLFAYYQESDLQSHPCHQQYPEVQANLYLPSLQAPQGVLSGQLDLDDPGVGKEKKKRKKKNSREVKRELWNPVRATKYLHSLQSCQMQTALTIPLFRLHSSPVKDESS